MSDFTFVSHPGGTPNRQIKAVCGQTKVHAHSLGDLLDREEAAPSVSWYSPGPERIPVPTSAGSRGPFRPSLCPLVASFHTPNLPCGISPASAQLAGPCGHRLPLSRFSLLQANDW